MVIINQKYYNQLNFIKNWSKKTLNQNRPLIRIRFRRRILYRTEIDLRILTAWIPNCWWFISEPKSPKLTLSKVETFSFYASSSAGKAHFSPKIIQNISCGVLCNEDVKKRLVMRHYEDIFWGVNFCHVQTMLNDVTCSSIGDVIRLNSRDAIRFNSRDVIRYNSRDVITSIC